LNLSGILVALRAANLMVEYRSQTTSSPALTGGALFLDLVRGTFLKGTRERINAD